MTDDDLPRAIGRPALGALRAAGINRLSEVGRLREEDLLALHGVGPRAVRLLRAELAERGLDLTDPDEGF
ncbi:DNA-binding protein [Blastococcus sp. KM273128]|uniref:DNA-binding protein n=1 Tax=Blastococcus sp. KM273128 TaxID=2570314 RepID=UPI001F25AA79|nr:DNA-binding protein [Blastococcus sp. KM273128]MCF6746215.1 DNA-binding protein [Blastococcus sp. KM273128]